MQAVLSHSCRAVFLAVLFVAASPSAIGNNKGEHAYGPGKRFVVLQVRGGS
jgi:hypothetical protein